MKAAISIVDTQSNLESSDVIIPDGMIAKVIGNNEFKVGNGINTFNELKNNSKISKDDNNALEEREDGLFANISQTGKKVWAQIYKGRYSTDTHANQQILLPVKSMPFRFSLFVVSQINPGSTVARPPITLQLLDKNLTERNFYIASSTGTQTSINLLHISSDNKTRSWSQIIEINGTSKGFTITTDRANPNNDGERIQAFYYGSNPSNEDTISLIIPPIVANSIYYVDAFQLEEVTIGAEGPSGPQGIQGIQGEQGEAGTNAENIYINGNIVPDYANIETTNRISTTTTATWTATKDGFVQINFHGSSVASMAWRPVCLINDVEVYRVSFAGGGSAGTTLDENHILQICKGDIIKLVLNDHTTYNTGTVPANSRNSSCYYIPPKASGNTIKPSIDTTSGNWFIGEEDTGVKAQGPEGPQGIAGTNAETIYVNGCMVPDYSIPKILKTNNIIAFPETGVPNKAGYEWIADADGFVTFYAHPTKYDNSNDNYNRLVVLVNGITLTQELFPPGTALKTRSIGGGPILVSKDDTIRVTNDQGLNPIADNGIFFITPKFILAPQEYAVDIEYDTGKIHPSGNKIYRKTYQIPSGTTISTTQTTVSLESAFGTSKTLTGLVTEMSYIKDAINTTVPINFTNEGSIFACSVGSTGALRIEVKKGTATTVSEGYVTVTYYYK